MRRGHHVGIGATLTSAGSKSTSFRWTPDESQGPGDYPVTVRVSDGSLTEDASLTLTVQEVNQAPTLHDVPSYASFPELTSYRFRAAAQDGDDPPQVLTFSLADEPDGATIDPETGEFYWNPTEDQGPGEYRFDVGVTDGLTTTYSRITLIVEGVSGGNLTRPVARPRAI